MKKAQNFPAWLIRQLLVCGALLVVAGCATNSSRRTDETLPAKVVRLKGEARWSNDDGKTWREIKATSKLPPGTLVQTAGYSRIDIGLDEATSATGYSLYRASSPVEFRMPSSTSFPRSNDQDNRQLLNPVRAPNNLIRLRACASWSHSF